MAGYLRQRFTKNSVGMNRSEKNLVGNSRRNSVVVEGDVSLLDELNDVATIHGEIFDYYRIEEELGRGAFARVFRGIEKTTGKEVAIKVVSFRSISEKALKENAERIARLKHQRKDISKAAAKTPEEITHKAKQRVVEIMKNEILVMKRVQSIPSRKRKNVVSLHNVIVNERRICVVMDLLTGGELFERIVKKKHYTERDAAFHIRRLMRALRTLHSFGIVHRDLKPENFIFEGPGENAQIKIADFGLACIIGQDDIHAKSIVGSHGYIAPEVLESKSYSPACDVWSMGVILYILFVGGPPFHGKSERELFTNIKTGQYRYPKSCTVSSMGRDLVAKMLVVNPKKRITIQGVLNHPWLVQKAATADLNIAVKSLQTFNAGRKLKAVSTAVLWGSRSGLRKDLYTLLHGTERASGFTGEELTLIRDALFKFKPSNRINRRQFNYAMKELGYVDLPLDEIYALFDSTGSGNADIVEICIGLSTASKDWNGSTQIKFCFETYDKNGTAKLSLNDVSKVMRVIASEMETNIARRFGSMFEKWKPTNNITFDELAEEIENKDSMLHKHIQHKPIAGIDEKEEDEEEQSESEEHGIKDTDEGSEDDDELREEDGKNEDEEEKLEAVLAQEEDTQIPKKDDGEGAREERRKSLSLTQQIKKRISVPRFSFSRKSQAEATAATPPTPPAADSNN